MMCVSTRHSFCSITPDTGAHIVRRRRVLNVVAAAAFMLSPGCSRREPPAAPPAPEIVDAGRLADLAGRQTQGIDNVVFWCSLNIERQALHEGQEKKFFLKPTRIVIRGEDTKIHAKKSVVFSVGIFDFVVRDGDYTLLNHRRKEYYKGRHEKMAEEVPRS